MTLLSGELLSVPAGIEPATPRLTVVCSNQLSYQSNFLFTDYRCSQEQINSFGFAVCISRR